MIGEVIQKKRKEMQLTQAQLAERLGVTAPAVNRWEKNLCFPDAVLLAPLARCLQTDLNELFSFYDSLSETERDLIVDKASMLFWEKGEQEARGYIKDMVRQNLSDGLLHKQLADVMLGMKTLAKPTDSKIYLEEMIMYYERALELLPDKNEKIVCVLITLYAELGNAEKAEGMWAQLPEKRQDKVWAHAEMLYMLKDYKNAADEIREAVLRKIIDLSTSLRFLGDTFSQCGETALADLAEEKRVELERIFDLWEGLDAINRIVSAQSVPCLNEQEIGLVDVFTETSQSEAISTCPLFKDVVLGGRSHEESTIADTLADFLSVVKKFK